MTKKAESATTPSPAHPPIGTLVDGNSLELVEVLGVGGYGVVYRAVDAFGTRTRSYAVKCLLSSHGQTTARRQLHIREVTLHQIASAHPGVVTLHRIVEEGGYTFIVMDYATEHDLFTQILHKCRYLGDDALIKHVFLQILDAVEYCHSLGIYHRDLKPENILCFDHGFRVAITDFGLATTDKMSEEYRTGSIYHMSPECQAAESKRTVPYSPMYNDIWSLGIILLNLATGRNPWKSATPEDPTYQAYRRNPLQFLPGVLPISQELNVILIQALEVNWKSRMTIPELRAAVERVRTFYSPNVVFEGSLARCPWESGMDLGNGVHKPPVQKRPVPKVPEVEPYCVVSMSSPIEIPHRSAANDFARPAWDATSHYSLRQETRLSAEQDDQVPYDPSAGSDYSSDPSSPATPSSFDTQGFAQIHLDEIELLQADPYGREDISYPYATHAYGSGRDDRFASSVFLATPICEDPPGFQVASSNYLYQYDDDKRLHQSAGSTSSRKEVPSSKGYYVHHRREGSFQPYRIPVDHVVPISPAVEDFPDKSTSSRPINIRGGGRRQHERTRSPNPLNPMGFFSASPTPSWLVPRTSAVRHQSPPTKTRLHHPAGPFNQQPGQGQQYQDVGIDSASALGRTLVDSQGRVAGSATASQNRPRRDWFSGKTFRN